MTQNTDDERRETNRWIIALDRLANTTFGPLMVHTWLAARRAGATRRGRHPGVFALIAGAAVAAAALAPGGGASAQAPTTRTLTFKENEAAGKYTQIPHGRRASRSAVRQGDQLVFTIPLLRGDGARAGTLESSCIATTGSKDPRKARLACTGVAVLGDGTLTLQGTIRPAGDAIEVAVTGGTGAYANARGTMRSVDEVDTFTLVASPGA